MLVKNKGHENYFTLGREGGGARQNKCPGPLGDKNLGPALVFNIYIYFTIVRFFRYGENAKKTSAIFRDGPLPQLEHAVYWIEYVSRHGGTAHLRTAANDLYWFQYWLLDVLLLLAVAVLAVLWLIKKTLVCGYRRCCRRSGPTASSVDQKKRQ